MYFLIIYLAISVVIFTCFTFFAKGQILSFFLLVSKIEANDNNNPIGISNNDNAISPANPTPNSTDKKKKSKRTLVIPKYLVYRIFFLKNDFLCNSLKKVKFSSTYFKKSLNESFNNLRKTIGKFPKPSKTHTRSISMNWAFRHAQMNPKKELEIKDIDNNILFTFPSEKERETARFDAQKDKKNMISTQKFNEILKKTKELEDIGSEVKKKAHARIYSMYNFQRRDDGMLDSTDREKKFEIKENKAEKSNINCLICFDKTPDSVFMECGHGGLSCIFHKHIYLLLLFLGICYECALDVWKTTGLCYLCRKVT